MTISSLNIYGSLVDCFQLSSLFAKISANIFPTPILLENKNAIFAVNNSIIGI